MATVHQPIPPEHYKTYVDFIRDGQIEPQDVPELLRRNPDFAAWFATHGQLGSVAGAPLALLY